MKPLPLSPISTVPLAIQNQSTRVSDDAVRKAIAAVQRQVTEDFAPVWGGLDAYLQFYGAKDAVPAASWLVGIFDTSDQAGALGYHDVTRTGKPLGKVFAGTTMDYGGLWTVTLSHEVLEMLADPHINLGALDEQSERLYAYEVCDAVEADALGYTIDGVRVSDFVLPAWFDPHSPRSARFAFKSKSLKRAFSLLPGGYISYLDLATGAWSQLEARKGTAELTSAVTYQKRARVGSRRERRRTPSAQWQRSANG